MTTDSDNVTAWSQPVQAIHRPMSTREVAELVRAVRARGGTLYPFSTGLNWGYGSRSPVLPGAEWVDLSGMNRIRNAGTITESHPVAVIEPGVSQGQLAQWLRDHCPALTFNTTGSGTATSIIGNGLDRGSGYVGPRSDDLFGFEFVTGTGEVVTTGFRRLGEKSPLADCHPFGLGPMLDGLCTQSNLVIVTSACLKLLPRRPVEAAVSIALKAEQQLPALIDELARLKRHGVMTTVTHVANRARTAFTLTPGIRQYLQARHGLHGSQLETACSKSLDAAAPASWSGLGGIGGTPAQVRALLAEIRGRLRPYAAVRLVTSERLAAAERVLEAISWWEPARLRAAALSSIRPLHGLVHGEPTDVPVRGLLEFFGDGALEPRSLDQSRCGLIYVNPALPPDGRIAVETVAAMQQVARSFGHELYVTINLETANSMVGVVNILFDRSSRDEIDRARRCADALYRCIRDRGLEVYRARPDLMAQVTSHNPEHWHWITALKSVLDPDGVIAPGRYCPASPAVGAVDKRVA